MSRPWPGRDDPIREVSYELVVSFNDRGEPVYKRGLARDVGTLQAIQTMLEAMEPAPASITSVTMGAVDLHLNSGARVTLRPVFHPSSASYGGLLKVDDCDLPMPPALATLLNQWRAELSR